MEKKSNNTEKKFEIVKIVGDKEERIDIIDFGSKVEIEERKSIYSVHLGYVPHNPNDPDILFEDQ